MTNPTISVGCSADCSACPIEAASHRPAGAYRGGRFAAVAAAFFLGPLALALAGAALAGPEPPAQFGGGAAGLLGGMVAAVLLARGAGASGAAGAGEVGS